MLSKCLARFTLRHQAGDDKRSLSIAIPLPLCRYLGTRLEGDGEAFVVWAAQYRRLGLAAPVMPATAPGRSKANHYSLLVRRKCLDAGDIWKTWRQLKSDTMEIFGSDHRALDVRYALVVSTGRRNTGANLQ